MRGTPLSWQGDPSRVSPDGSPGPVDVIVPVYGAPEAFARCVDSLVTHTDLERDRLVLVIDGPQPPSTDEIVARLRMERAAGVLILENPENQGFVASVNRGMSSSTRDVVLLNSDTLATRGWLPKLQAAAYSAPEVGTVTPFSNSATICSLPRFAETNALPAGWDADSFGELVESRSQRLYPRLPTGVGVCLYIKRKVLDAVGLFDRASFGHGYGEESEFCMRALKAGYAHVLDDATFIFHEGQRSFGASRETRVRSAHRVMRRLHPEYMATVARFLEEDPVRPARERVVRELLPPRRPQPPGRPERILHVVHGWPPWNHAGTELYAAWLVRRQAAHREVAVFARIADPERSLGDAVELLDGGARVRLIVNNFLQRDPLSRNALRDAAIERDFVRLLDDVRPELVHIHHLAGHTAALPRLAARRRVPVVYQIQDWWAPCARVNLLDRWRRACSGPGLGKCSACLPLTGLPPAPLLNRALYSYRLAVLKDAVERADAWVMGSRFLRQTYQELGYRLPEDRVHVIPYGVELGPRAARREPGETLRFGIIGSIQPHKGIHVAIAAFAGLDPRRAALSIWGDPKIDPEYARELESLRGAGSITLRGRFEEDRKAEIFAEMDVLILPSLGLESFGLVAREAMHHSVPVIVAGRGALPEIFDAGASGGDPFGTTYEPEDPLDLRAAIERLLADPGLLDRWVAALPPVKGADEHAEEIERVYERVFEKRLARRRQA